MSGNTIRVSIVLARWIPLALAVAVLSFGCGGGGGGGGNGSSASRAWLEAGAAQPGTTAQTYLRVSDATGIAGLDLELTFDPSLLSVSSVSTTALTNDFVMSYNEQPAGVLKASMARATGLSAVSANQRLLDVELDVSQIAQPASSIPISVALTAYDAQPSLMSLPVQDAEIMVR